MRSARQSATSESESWCRYFSTIAVAEDHLPWGHPTRLSGEEKHCIAKSIQQFQLGESSSGRRLLQRGLAYSRSADDSHFVSALSLFVKEEQRHSSRLLRFMQREGIPTSRKHWGGYRLPASSRAGRIGTVLAGPGFGRDHRCSVLSRSSRRDQLISLAGDL